MKMFHFEESLGYTDSIHYIVLAEDEKQAHEKFEVWYAKHSKDYKGSREHGPLKLEEVTDNVIKVPRRLLEIYTKLH